MSVDTPNAFWRRALAIGVLPFAVLGIAGCDNSEPADEAVVGEEVEEDPEPSSSFAEEDPSVEGDLPEDQAAEEEEEVIEEEAG